MTVALPKKFAKANLESMRVALPKKQEADVCNNHCRTIQRESDCKDHRMTQPIDALQMAKHAGADVYGQNVDMTAMSLENLVGIVLERAAVECEQSEAYRGSVFAQRIRALKPVQD